MEADLEFGALKALQVCCFGKLMAELIEAKLFGTAVRSKE
jgi:hypothetical protein